MLAYKGYSFVGESDASPHHTRVEYTRAISVLIFVMLNSLFIFSFI